MSQEESNRLLSSHGRTSDTCTRPSAQQPSSIVYQPKKLAIGPNRVATDEEILAAAGGKKAVEAYRKRVQEHQAKTIAENERRAAEYAKRGQSYAHQPLDGTNGPANARDDDDEEIVEFQSSSLNGSGY